MVSDSELVARLHEFLRSSDLNTTTTAIVRRKLEEDFGIDLSGKKAFIREHVDLFLQSQLEKAEEDEGDGGEEEEEEHKSNVKSEGSNGSDSKDENDDDDDEEEEVEESSNGKGAKKRGSKKSNKEVKKRGGGFCKLCSLSPELQKFIGVPELARTEVVKQLWVHIREKDLQDPNNRRNIICDETLRALFGVDSINMFQMNKALSKHIWPLDSDDEGLRSHARVPFPTSSLAIYPLLLLSAYSHILPPLKLSSGLPAPLVLVINAMKQPPYSGLKETSP
ncbi:Upstream activation factor subunit spp27 [Vitis vinifera]|uniref:Upstream activation factor subunit spp27 n=1 Tax=Vitis vinifera TaxID=29760 RepID=A0A438FCA0_VITVI|nr:Upstream activation factor subunit spp27 [Vitis vinifera]